MFKLELPLWTVLIPTFLFGVFLATAMPGYEWSNMLLINGVFASLIGIVYVYDFATNKKR